jgi:hypothetical protein
MSGKLNLVEELLEAQISNISPNDTKRLLARWHWLIEQHDKEIIERCVQITEIFNGCDAYSREDGKHITKHIAAAILTTLDKPPTHT